MPLPIAAGAMAAVGFIGPMFVHSLFSIIIGASPLAEFTRQQFNQRWPLFLAPMPDLVRERLLEVIDESTFQALMARQGFDATQTANILAGAESLLDASHLVFANFRGIIEDGEYERQMLRNGFSAESLTAFKEVSRFFPAVPDLVTFAVREVYTPSIREEYQLDADWPERFGEEAAKAGLDLEQAKNYWAAHWILPSVQMGYEMLHRGVITQEQLMTLLKTQDIMPFWRQPLIDISYNPLTRVDVRRMYRLGVLDVDAVFKAYKDIGYNDENAGLMTDFTVAYETQEEKTLTKSEVLRGYNRKALAREETIEWLGLIGYPPELAETIVLIEDAKLIQDETDETIDIVVDQYVDGQIDKAKLEDELGLLELTPAQVSNIIWKADRKKQRAIKMPSIADIRRWVDDGQVTREDGLAMLTKLNIPSEYVPFYLGEKKRLPSVSDIRRWYANDILDAAKAESLLTELGIPPEFVTFYLIEKERLPSVSDIKGWAKAGIIEEGRAQELLALLKVPEEFIPLYLEEKLRTPSIKDVQVWLSEGFIDESKAKKLLTALEIPSDLHDFYLKEKMRIPTIKDVQKWYGEDFIDRARAVGLLTSINVRPEFIELYLTEIEAKKEEEE